MGFTLIELLAVIVILAMIALIATPIVLDIIKSSKKSAVEESAKNIVSAAETYYASKLLYNEKISTIDLSSDSLKYDGEKVTKGNLTIDSDGNISGKIYISGYCIEIKNNSIINNQNITEDECEIKIGGIDDNPILSEDFCFGLDCHTFGGLIVNDVIKGDSSIASYIVNPIRYSEPKVKNAITTFEKEDIVTLNDILLLLNLDINSINKDEAGNEIDLTKYEFIAPFSDIGIKKNGTLDFQNKEPVNLRLCAEVAKDFDADNLLFMYISPFTGNVSFTSIDDYDTDYGYFNVTMKYLGPAALLAKNED